MSMNVEGQKCPVCHAYFFEEDDVVFCPECGAPHHRDCYQSLGHCAFEQQHGTAQQYTPPEPKETQPPQPEKKEHPSHAEVTCQMCGEHYDIQQRGCPRCGAPRMPQRGYMVFDLLGGVPADMDLGEGVTADEAKRFVMANTPRYIPKFAAIAAGKKYSWNWLAFLLPWAWFASRKMYLNAVITAIFGIASSILSMPLIFKMNQLGLFSEATNYMQLAGLAIDAVPPALFILAGIGLLIGIIVRVICGVFGDEIYRKRVIAGVKQIKTESEDADVDYRKYGGVSFWALLLAIFAVQYLPQIIANFIF